MAKSKRRKQNERIIKNMGIFHRMKEVAALLCVYNDLAKITGFDDEDEKAVIEMLTAMREMSMEILDKGDNDNR